MLLQFTPHQQVEALIGSAQLDVGLHRHRVVALNKRVEELVNGDGLIAAITLGKVVPLQHARHRLMRGEANHVGGAELVHPGRIEADLGLVRIEDLEHLILVGAGVVHDLFARQGRARGVLAARITDHAGEIADQELDPMAEFLEMPQLVDQHRVTEMKVGRGRVEARLHAQGAAALEAFDQLDLEQERIGATFDQLDGRRNISHSISPKIPFRPRG